MGIFDKIRDGLLSKIEGNETDKLGSPLDQTADELKLAAFVKSKVEEVRASANRIAHEGIWMTNIAYVLGFDSIYYDTTTRQFKPLGRGTQYIRRNRVHSNKILPAVQNRLARLCKSPPKYDTVPNSETDEDKEAARLGLEVIGQVWNQEKMNQKRITLGMWVQECGHAFLRVFHDEHEGEPLVDPISDKILGYEGNVKVEVCSPFEVFCDPLATDMDQIQWLVNARVRKLDYFKTHYDRGYLVKEEGPWLMSTQYELRINSLNNTGPNTSGTTLQMKNAAIELSYYEKRSSKHPNGRHIIVAGGVVLKDDDLPVGKIPFAKFDDVLVAGKFYSESCITHARPLQDQYNNVLARRSEWVRKCLAGKYIAAKGHGLMQEALNDQSGEVVEYDVVPGATEPHAMQIPQMPEYAYQENKDLESQIYEIFGLSEVSRGQLPSAGIPAVGMQLLLEQDETRIGIETEQHEHSYAYIGQLILRYVDKFYQMNRKLKTRGTNMEYQVKDFTGKDLKKNFDVTVIRGSTVPNSKFLDRQEILNLYNGGLLGDPKDPSVREKVLGMLEFGDVADVWLEERVDKAQVKRTMEEIKKQIRPVVDEMDNHEMHIKVKNRFRKTDAFEHISPLSQQLLMENIKAHIDAMAGIMNPQIKQMKQQRDQLAALTPQEAAAAGMIPNGAPPPGPGGPPPMVGPMPGGPVPMGLPHMGAVAPPPI